MLSLKPACDYSFQKDDERSIYLSGRETSLFFVSVLEDQIFRVCHRPRGVAQLPNTWLITDGEGQVPLEGRPRDDLSRFARTDFEKEISKTGDCFQLSTGSLTVIGEISSPRLVFLDKSGAVIDEDLPELAYATDAETGSIFHYKRRDRSLLFFGLGEKSGRLNRHGRRYRMFNLDAGRYNAEFSDPLYKHYPFYIAFDPESGYAWAYLYDNFATSYFDMGAEHHNFYPSYRYYHAEAGDLDCYFIFGPDIKGVLEKLAYLTGYMTLPPRYTLGYLGSTMHYTEAEDAQAQLAKFPALCEEHDIPCDLFHLSSGYSKHGDGKRYVFEWNYNRVPEPEVMCERFQKAGIKLTANVKPCLLNTHPRFEEVKNTSGFIKRSGSKCEPRIDRFWDGDGAHLDFTRVDTINWWKSRLKESLLCRGIDAIWNDNNEFAIFDDKARVDGFGHDYELGLFGRPLETLLMAMASFSALEEHAPDKRPYLITRSGCPGIQRYAQSWTGDNDCNWHTLKFNIPMGLGLSLSGMPNIGHDVGGFFGDKPEPELFVRWIQNGIFHPRFTIHSWHDDGSVNEPWMYPEQLNTVRALIKFRYRIIPYLYSLLVEASHTGQPIIRPLVYEFPQDKRCHDRDFDFLLGSHWLIASVFEPGAVSREVYLPEGSRWCEFDSGEWYEGGSFHQLDAPLTRVPTLVREGGLIPVGHGRRISSPREDDLREVLAFPFQKWGRSSFTLYEDDGISLAYREGAQTALKLKMESDAESIHIDVDPIQSGYPLSYSEIEWIFPDEEDRQIKGADRVTKDNDGKTRALFKLKN